jgi:hypothetical protein
MDINQQLQPIVATLLDDLKEKIEAEIRISVTQEMISRISTEELSAQIDAVINENRNTITQEIVNKVTSAELFTIVDQVIKEQISEKLLKYNIETTTQTQLDNLVKKLTVQIESGLVSAANKQITEDISRKLAQFDISTAMDNLVEKKLGTLASTGRFPQNSIHHTSVNFKDFKISGTQVKGGIVENFSSTGIEDRATKVTLTLLDRASVFENTVFAPKLEVKGNLTVDGTVTLKGDIATDTSAFDTIVEHSKNRVKQEINEELFQGFSATIHKNLVEQGVDLDRITQGGREVIKGPQLGYHIVDSNLQRLGVVNDLQTAGENLLSDTLYVTTRRVGVNTIDPSAVLAVWDEEVELIVAKRKQDTGYIGTTRHQRVILGSNNKENITLNTDGTVEIDQLSIGNVPMSSASVTPNYEGITGQIVWNESPSLGGCVGWICLGKTRWAKFGSIE